MFLIWTVLLGEGLGFCVFRAWTEGDSESESIKKQRPPGLTGVQSLCCPKVGKILVISEDSERVLRSL